MSTRITGSLCYSLIISPTGDNINDVFTIFPNDKVDIIAIDGSVFDRWGNQVFHSNTIPFTWDGNADDEDVVCVHHDCALYRQWKRSEGEVCGGCDGSEVGGERLKGGRNR